MDYPSEAEEHEIVRRHTEGSSWADLDQLGIRAVATVDDIRAARAELRQSSWTTASCSYVTAIARATREHGSVTLGASPRAAVSLLSASKAYALLAGPRLRHSR